MRSDLHHGCHQIHSLVKEVRTVSETKKIAVGFIRLQKSHSLQHTSSSRRFWTPSTIQEWTPPGKTAIGKGAVNMIHGGSSLTRGI